ncbi:hypothetical protein MNV49_000372 [Pseudohyphozyma bogoriensis]|nr:hypothetical protein MNV49_000372 [Pseudohyphozyma bogoriensis]
MLTSCGSAAFLFGAGDVLAQQAVEKKGKDHDFLRTARLTFYGGAFFAPIVGKWYGMLESIKLKNKYALVATRVGLDQFVLTPVMVGAFFTSMSLLEGKGIEEAKRRIETSWQPTLIRNWGVFIPVQLANFSVVPPHLRLLLVNVVSLFWNAYLSYANSVSQAPVDKAIEDTENKIVEVENKIAKRL